MVWGIHAAAIIKTNSSDQHMLVHFGTDRDGQLPFTEEHGIPSLSTGQANNLLPFTGVQGIPLVTTVQPVEDETQDLVKIEYGKSVSGTSASPCVPLQYDTKIREVEPLVPTAPPMEDESNASDSLEVTLRTSSIQDYVFFPSDHIPERRFNENKYHSTIEKEEPQSEDGTRIEKPMDLLDMEETCKQLLDCTREDFTAYGLKNVWLDLVLFINRFGLPIYKRIIQVVDLKLELRKALMAGVYFIAHGGGPMLHLTTLIVQLKSTRNQKLEYLYFDSYGDCPKEFSSIFVKLNERRMQVEGENTCVFYGLLILDKICEDVDLLTNLTSIDQLLPITTGHDPVQYFMEHYLPQVQKKYNQLKTKRENEVFRRKRTHRVIGAKMNPGCQESRRQEVTKEVTDIGRFKEI